MMVTLAIGRYRTEHSIFNMSDRQSQAHSTHLKSFNNRFRKVLRLNRDHKGVHICLYMTGYREHIEEWNSVTRTRCSDRRGIVVDSILNCAFEYVVQIQTSLFKSRLETWSFSSLYKMLRLSRSGSCITRDVVLCAFVLIGVQMILL